MRPTELMAYWIAERESMRIRKENGERHFKHGYSDDPCMGTVRYCNVRREDDKVTRWLAQHWRPQHHAVWEITLARMVNYIPTLERLISVERATGRNLLDIAATEMKTMRADGQKIWTSAYTISTAGSSMDKVDYVMGRVQRVRETWGDCGDFRCGDVHLPTLKEAHAELLTVNGLGNFLAAQVVADLKNTKGHILRQAADWHTWSASGPGSLKGLSEYFGAHITPRLYQQSITRCWDEVRPLLPRPLQDLHMQDFQNCLCEFGKFMRVRKGGHARNKYPSR